MLGVVFSELMDMVEESFPPEVFDHLIEIAETRFDSAGDYTAVGNYSHEEMVELVKELAAKTDVPFTDLVEAYGRHLFGRFNDRYAAFFDGIDNSFAFLAGIENRIHAEVRKLYPQAELPHFDVQTNGPNELVLDYASQRPFALLAKGLIQGCIEHFKDNVTFEFEDTSGGNMTNARFVLRRE